MQVTENMFHRVVRKVVKLCHFFTTFSRSAGLLQPQRDAFNSGNFLLCLIKSKIWLWYFL